MTPSTISRHILWLALLALATASCSSGSESSNDDPSNESVTTTSGIAAPSASEPQIEAEDDSVDDSQSLEIAVMFWEALEAGDRESALGLVDPEAIEGGALDVGPSPFGRAHTLAGQFDWYETVGWTWALEECVEGDIAIECTATANTAWMEALGVEPITGTFLVSVGDSGVLDVADQSHSFISQYSPQVFRIFAGWVGRSSGCERSDVASSRPR